MNEFEMQFSEVAEEMHAGAAEREEFENWLDEVAGSVPDPLP